MKVLLGSETLLVYLCATVFAFLVLHVWKYRRYYYFGFKLPGPSFLRNLLYVSKLMTGGMDVKTRNILRFYRDECANNDYSLMKCWYGPKLLVIICDPNLVNEAYKYNLQKDTSIYRFIKPFIGTGNSSIFIENQLNKWRSDRKIIGAANFSFASLKSFVEIIFQESLILGDKLSPLAKSKQAFELDEMMTLAIFGTILRTMCGLDLKIQENFQSLHEHIFIDSAENAFQSMSGRLFKPWLLSETFSNMIGYNREANKRNKLSQDFVEEVIAKIKENIIEENAKRTDEQRTQSVEDSDQTDRPQSFIKAIIRDQLDPNSEGLMSHNDLVGEVTTLLSAGFDTTRTENIIVLILLALHPHIQQQVYDEIESVMGQDPYTAPTYYQLQELDLLTRVIKETLRLFPAGPVISRQLEHEIDLGGYTIPVGASLAVIILSIHTDPRYWPNPHQFDPDRFLPSESAKRHPNAYMPFSTGPRNCLGNKYAMMSMKTTLSTLLRRYRVLPGDKCKSIEDIKYEFGLTMTLLPGCDLRLEPRDVKCYTRNERPVRQG